MVRGCVVGMRVKRVSRLDLMNNGSDDLDRSR